MLKDVRTAGGLGKPPNKFTNNRPEAVNNEIKEITDRDDLVTFLTKIEEMVIKEQENMLTKAMYGFGEYQLRDAKSRIDPTNYSQ